MSSSFSELCPSSNQTARTSYLYYQNRHLCKLRYGLPFYSAIHSTQVTLPSHFQWHLYYYRTYQIFIFNFIYCVPNFFSHTLLLLSFYTKTPKHDTIPRLPPLDWYEGTEKHTIFILTLIKKKKSIRVFMILVDFLLDEI